MGAKVNDKTPYISIYSTDDEVATYATYVGECAENVRKCVRRCDMTSTEFATAVGVLLAVSSLLARTLPARLEYLRQQRAEVRDMAEHRRRRAQLERRDEPSRG